MVCCADFSVSTDSPKESFRDTIEIGVDVVHRVLVTPTVFPASTVRWEEIKEDLRALRERADMAETERITLRARVRSLEVVETWLHGIVRDRLDERLVRGFEQPSWVCVSVSGGARAVLVCSRFSMISHLGFNP
ncbi:hypothetical protein Tco_0905984 [Tanacetum coccineum]